MTFKEQLSSDLTEVFFKTGEGEEFAEVWTYRPAISSDGSADYPISVIPDATTEIIEPQSSQGRSMGSARVQSAFVRVMVKEADVIGGVQNGDRILNGLLVYLIIQKDSDGVGVVTLILQEAP
jgi:hypothetical protein